MKRNAALIALLLPALAHAHAASGDAAGFLRGLQHPLGGIDHVVAMVAVGAWAAQRGGQALWLLPATFIVTTAVSGLLGAAGAPIPFAEHGILLSLLVLGALVAGAVRLPPAASAAIVGLFALFHGHAHGVETPVDVPGSAYGAGFLVATAFLHGLGIALALLARRIARKMAWS